MFTSFLPCLPLVRFRSYGVANSNWLAPEGVGLNQIEFESADIIWSPRKIFGFLASIRRRWVGWAAEGGSIVHSLGC